MKTMSRRKFVQDTLATGLASLAVIRLPSPPHDRQAETVLQDLFRLDRVKGSMACFHGVQLVSTWEVVEFKIVTEGLNIYAHAANACTFTFEVPTVVDCIRVETDYFWRDMPISPRIVSAGNTLTVELGNPDRRRS